MKGKRHNLCSQCAYRIWHLILILESIKYLEICSNLSWYSFLTAVLKYPSGTLILVTQWTSQVIEILLLCALQLSWISLQK